MTRDELISWTLRTLFNKSLEPRTFHFIKEFNQNLLKVSRASLIFIRNQQNLPSLIFLQSLLKNGLESHKFGKRFSFASIDFKFAFIFRSRHSYQQQASLLQKIPFLCSLGAHLTFYIQHRAQLNHSKFSALHPSSPTNDLPTFVLFYWSIFPLPVHSLKLESKEKECKIYILQSGFWGKVVSDISWLWVLHRGWLNAKSVLTLMWI